ncbi:unnamed protein product [Clonostachys chloroleuca]|uniref:Nucleoprotein TPR/MLP1 domain-containing protein n=1 Tax=Clonostachys chloroleuca TaxID=1926264 RepID=A0AA35QD77_9HYPO|nr:unnamed protein product [Clonostachys chloroleuca]
MAAADVDVGYIAGHLGLDEPVVQSLATEPTLDLVTALLQAVATKAHEFDELYATKLQIDIELENAVRSAESRYQASRESTEKALKDLEEARQKLKEEETTRLSLENELQSLKTKGTGHEAELKALNDKIETLQSSNRTSLSIIESNNKRDQALSEELTKQHQKNSELSREITSLQQAEQNAKGQLSSAKYREESLQQQLTLARRNSEWLESELKTKSEEGLKYRKEKGARIAELQRQNEDAKADIDSLKRGEQQLRDRLSTMQAKADEALVKLQKQEAAFATTVESYKHELGDQRRLVDMSDQLSKKHQQRVSELESEKERLKDNYENEIHRLRLELEQERQANTELEEKISQLEAQIEQLQTRPEFALPSSRPQTPRPNGAALGRPSSPFATPGSIRSKSALTATQAIGQVSQLKDELAKERRKNNKLREDIDDMMAALEAKGPEFQELQSENETLRTEITRMSELSQKSFEDRDNAKKAARKAENALQTAQSEAKILRMQVRDLGTQIQMLVFNIYAMEKGMDQLSEEEKIRLQQLSRGEITEEALSDMSDTHQFITQRLVVFKDIQSLQQKNEENAATIRQLAEQMDSDEAIAAKRQAKEDHDKVQRLEQELSHMADETNSMRAVIESCKRERDMFRRILQQRGAVADDSSMLRASFSDSQRLPLSTIEPGEQVEALNEALRKLQSEFDGYRSAQEGVRTDFRTKVDNLTSEKNSLQTDKIKLQGEVKLESERREMLQSNYAALQTQNVELQKRSQILSEAAAKQDIRTQQVAEELVEAKGLLDSMRNEAANLKAEKKLWSDIHERLTKDNETLIEEKNRLNNIISTQQSLENERTLAESEARRKAQARVETLERELADTHKKLTQEAEETKNVQLRKEYEGKEAQKRIDELMASLSQLREEHVATKTSRDHLQARVNELTVELRNAEERVGRLQPRPTPRPGSTAESSQQQQDAAAEIEDLNNEVSDLKRELDLAKTYLDNAKAQAEQYRELSQSNEEALEDLRSSQEQYQQEMEAIVEEKNAKIKELQQRIDDVSSELSQTNTELSSLRDSQGEVTRRFQDEKAILEEELNRLKEESSRHVEAARFHQQDLRAQAEIASKAQQDYEQELVKHAEAAKLVQQLRTEYNELKSESASLRAEAESAKVALSQSEGSWEDQRQRLEQEMQELKARREDVNAQNKLLHQQLESLTAQVTSLQQSRSSEDNDEAMSPVAFGDVSEGLRELNSYLRREKEILEVQYDLKTQEAKRLQQQLEYTQTQLDEARLKMDQERSQASQNNRGSMSHHDLMEKLNELNLYRESSMMLRNENARMKDAVTEKSKLVEEMEAKIQPLEAEIESLKGQQSFLEEEIKQVQEDRDRWQKRTEGILTKYGRADPAELEGLKEKVATLETENQSLKEGEQPLKDKVSEIEALLESERATWANTRARLAEQFKERSKRLTGEKNEANQRVNQLQEQLDKATEELSLVRTQVEELNGQKSGLEQQLQNHETQVAQLQQQVQEAQNAANQQPAAVPTPVPADPSASSDEARQTQLEQQLGDARQELESVSVQKKETEQQLELLRSQLQSAIAERDEAVRSLQEAAASAKVPAPESADQVDNTGEASTEPLQPNAAASGLSEAEKKQLEDKITAAEAKAAESEQKAADIEARISSIVKERSDRMKETLNNRLRDSKAKLEEEFKGKSEDLKLKFEQEKQIWLAENSSTAQPGEQPPSTPAKTEPPAGGVPATPSTNGPVDLSHLDDASVRSFLASNATVKSIIAANIKKKVESEQAKTVADYEAKIVSAREQAQLLESKKSTLRINMFENKLRQANAKIGVVETAAKETPQKPVVEVWEVAKTTVPPPATPAAGARPTPARQASTAGAAGGPSTPTSAKPAAGFGAPSPSTVPTLAAPLPPKPAGQQTPAAAAPAPAASTPGQVNNPFAVPADSADKTAPNPFAAKPADPATPVAQTQQRPPTQQQDNKSGQQANAQQGQQGRTGIPLPRGGGRGRGTYVAPGQRNASAGDSGLPQPGGGRGGRGGARGGRGGMNPGASDFQPGNKRPRGDSEAGGGAKRPRGSH